uniref:Uncharacterized protein n=1 Tax=Grammatophora oceanica TaxID=210454 RepID=A0A7S1UPR1_9STRA
MQHGNCRKRRQVTLVQKYHKVKYESSSMNRSAAFLRRVAICRHKNTPQKPLSKACGFSHCHDDDDWQVAEKMREIDTHNERSPCVVDGNNSYSCVNPPCS